MAVRSLASFVAVVGLSAGAAGACGSSTAEAIGVTSTQTKCTAEKTSLPAGKLRFEVENKGNEVTELYVYGKGDRVISEVENVGPGTSRALTVNLKAGNYELACKPGMTGKGIRVPIHVHGSGGSQGADSAQASEEVEVTATDYSFSLSSTSFEKGETIEFELINEGEADHEFELLDPNGKVVGEIEPIGPGQEGKATMTLEEKGNYTYLCDVDDHRSRGMRGTLEVE